MRLWAYIEYALKPIIYMSTTNKLAALRLQFKKQEALEEFNDLVYSILASSSLSEFKEAIVGKKYATSAMVIINALEGDDSWKAFTTLVERLFGKPQQAVEAKVEAAVEFRLRNEGE